MRQQIEDQGLEDTQSMVQKPFLHKRLARLAVSAAPAALATVSLFLMMDRLITTDEIHLAEAQTYGLETITPQHKDTDARSTKRTPPQKLPDATEPPPPPKLSTNKANIDLLTPTIQGAAPSEVGFDRVEMPDFGPIGMSDRDAQPIRPPIAQYPERPLRSGLEGNCDVRFDVDVRGHPYNIEATCSSGVFEHSAVRAVSKAEFAPKIVRGQPVERRDVVYPLVYQIEE